MVAVSSKQVRVGTMEELKSRGCIVVSGSGHAIAVFPHEKGAFAVDNRCPHMGFPLDRGTVRDGILTCHWHHARVDLCSGGTFDPFADDVPAFNVTVSKGIVWVDPSPMPIDRVEHWHSRLKVGLEDNIRLIIAKSVLGLDSVGCDYTAALEAGSHFGMTYSNEGWGQAMSILTCAANLLPDLDEEDRLLAMYQGLRHVATECAGKPPRFAGDPLPAGETRSEVFNKWFRSFVEVRNEDGAERCLRSAIEVGLPQSDISDIVFGAITDHIYLDAGHTLDFANKSFELLDHIGWDHAGAVLSSLVHGMATARRSEELNSWRSPIDISSLVWKAREALPSALEEGQRRKVAWDKEDDLADVMLRDCPSASLDAILEAISEGATPEQMGSAVAYAAFLRMARFHTSNEFNDWDTVHNTLTAANAVHPALKRAPTVNLLRAVLDTAMSVYLDRFLNIPAQRMPESSGIGLDIEDTVQVLFDHMDMQHNVEEVSALIAGSLTEQDKGGRIVAALGHAMLREDSGFHLFQIMDAAIQQYRERRGTHSGTDVLIGMSRYLAAHTPTSRAVGQTFMIAQRLHRGEALYADGPADDRAEN